MLFRLFVSFLNLNYFLTLMCKSSLSKLDVFLYDFFVTSFCILYRKLDLIVLSFAVRSFRFEKNYLFVLLFLFVAQSLCFFSFVAILFKLFVAGCTCSKNVYFFLVLLRVYYHCAIVSDGLMFL